MENRQKASCIITTKNEEDNLEACIKSILNQSYGKEDIEIVVIDNNSIDNTVSIARRYTDKVFNCGPERSAQRNFGIKKATGKYILYLDADMILSKEVIKECVEECQNDVVALYIPERIIGKGFWIKVRDFERSFYNATCIDAVRFVNKDKALEIGGFDEDLNGPEDWDFDRRIKKLGKTDTIHSQLYHNEGIFSLKRYIQKKTYYGRSFEKYIEKWGSDDLIIRKQLGVFYRLVGVFLEYGRWKRLIAKPLLTLGMFYLRTFTGCAYMLSLKRRALEVAANKKKGILIISPFFRPNIGGVETHLDDLCDYLTRNDCYVWVITYQPLTTKAKAASLEKKENLEIHRVPWFGYNWFHKLESKPLIEFIYLFPAIFIFSLFFVIRNKNVNAFHAQGLVAAFVGAMLKIFFKKRLVTSTHAIYNLDKRPVLSKVIIWILGLSDRILTLSNQSKAELIKIGIPETKIKVYTYWVNQDVFRPLDRDKLKNNFGWGNKFIVMFVGRLLEIKGVYILLDAAKYLAQNIYFVFIGDGPCAGDIKDFAGRMKNVVFLGSIENKMLPVYYNAADVVCVPSQYEEGFGRVILEAVSCGTPVIASNKGGIPEVVNSDIGILISPNVNDILIAVESLYKNTIMINTLRNNCRSYALKHFSSKNAELILDSYNI